MEDDESEPTYSLGDMLVFANLMDEAEHQEIQGWGNEKHCSYGKHEHAMNVYSCLTCKEKENRYVGVCFGCSMNCHLDHKIVELFKKRDFECDCPTLSCIDCKLREKVELPNRENVYNENYDGLFCWCKKEYHHDDVMIQCVICEDWYHDHCIREGYEGIMYMEEEDEVDYVCRTCTEKYQFLKKYTQCLKKEEEVEGEVNENNEKKEAKEIENRESKEIESEASKKVETNEDIHKDGNLISIKGNDSSSSKPINDSHNNSNSIQEIHHSQSSSLHSQSSSLHSQSSSDCLISGKPILILSDAFFKKGWVSQLCTCDQCLVDYESSSFLRFYESCFVNEDEDIDIGGSPEESPTKKRSNPFSTEDDITKKPKPLTAYQEITLANRYHKLTTALKKLFEEAQQSGKVIKEEDVKEFVKKLHEQSDIM